MLTGHLEIHGLSAEEVPWNAAKQIVMEAVPWADSIVVTSVTQPLVEVTLLAGPNNDERVTHQPHGPLHIYFVATGVEGLTWEVNS